MKNRLLKKSITGLIIFLSVVNLGFAADSFSVSVSCTIPAVPGVNAPLIEETTLETQEMTSQLIQQNDQEEKTINEEQKTTIIVKTIYSR